MYTHLACWVNRLFESQVALISSSSHFIWSFSLHSWPTYLGVSEAHFGRVCHKSRRPWFGWSKLNALIERSSCFGHWTSGALMLLSSSRCFRFFQSIVVHEAHGWGGESGMTSEREEGRGRKIRERKILFQFPRYNFKWHSKCLLFCYSNGYCNGWK